MEAQSLLMTIDHVLHILYHSTAVVSLLFILYKLFHMSNILQAILEYTMANSVFLHEFFTALNPPEEADKQTISDNDKSSNS